MSTADERIPLLTFRLAHQYYALALDNVIEVAAMVAVTNLPDTSPAFLGIANRHGEPLPMLDMRHAFNLPAATIAVSTLFIVAEIQKTRLGLVVDEIFQVKYMQEAVFQTIYGAGKHISHVISDGDHLYQLIDLASLSQNYLNSMQS
jgi:purine-binding chemotaxis protein CheW